METIYLDDFLCDQINKEKEFRKKVVSENWKKY